MNHHAKEGRDAEQVLTSEGSRSHRVFHLAFSLGLLILPILTGVSAAQRWPAITGSYYETVAQIIATLFIAIAVEFFTRRSAPWDDRLDQVVVLCLVALSWSGLLGSIRATIDGGGTRLTSGLAVAGLVSSSVLVSLALFERIGATKMLWVFLVPPVLIFVIL